MERFGIITFPDSGLMLTQKSRLLRRLPKRVATFYNHMMGPRPIDTISDRKSGVELGKIYNIPTLHYDGQSFIFEGRERQLNLLIKELKENDIGLLSAPFIEDIFSAKERATLNKNGINVLGANYYRLLTLYACMPKLLKILGRRLPYLEVGLWRADTDLGKAWAYLLAPYLNKLTIGGEDLNVLYNLSSEILKETGLSCQVTESLANCMEGKDLSISTDSTAESEYKGEIDILSYPIDIQTSKNVSDRLSFHSGNLELPCDPKINISLNPWEHLALSNNLLYILNGDYRELVMGNTLDIHTFNKFIRIIRKHRLRLRGVVNAHETISYDRFRMIYFKDGSNNKKVG